MPISKDKVLLVVNSDEPLSAQVADYYIQARGLTRHVVSLPMGSQTFNTLTVTQAQVATVAQYIQANSIQAVICSAKTPSSITVPAINPQSVSDIFANCSLANVLGASVMLVAQNWKTKDGLHNIVETSTSQNFVKNGTGEVPELAGNNQSDYPTYLNLKTNIGIIPHGRIGVPRHHLYYPEETFAFCKRIIDDAIANEKSFETAKDLPIHFAFDGSYLNGWQKTEMARRRFLTKGMSNSRHCKVSAPGDGTNLMGAIANHYVPTDFMAKTIPAQYRDAWAFFGFFANLYGATDADSSNWDAPAGAFNFLPGAWGTGGASYGCSELGARFIHDGACAFSGTVNEPFSGALLNTDTFTRMILMGMSMCEAANYSNMTWPWQGDTWGDPLYRPFGKQNFILMG